MRIGVRRAQRLLVRAQYCFQCICIHLVCRLTLNALTLFLHYSSFYSLQPSPGSLVSIGAAVPLVAGAPTAALSWPPRRMFAAGDTPAAPTPKPGGGGKKKKEKSHKFAHADSGKKFGHGAEDRPSPAIAREAARRQRAAAAASDRRHLDADGNILTDDEAMQPVYDLVNKGTISAEELKQLRSAFPDNLRGERGEELDALSRELHHAEYAKLLKIPDRLKDKVRIADDDMDYLAITGEASARRTLRSEIRARLLFLFLRRSKVELIHESRAAFFNFGRCFYWITMLLPGFRCIRWMHVVAWFPC